MNYEQAAERYLAAKKDMEALDREFKERKAKVREKLVVLENWFTAKAQEDGLASVKTNCGTYPTMQCFSFLGILFRI